MNEERSQLATALIFAGLALMLVLGFVAFMMMDANAGANAGFVYVIMGVVTFGAILGVGALMWVQRNQQNTEKAKRGLDGLDTFTLIDRMVEDLSPEEALYLEGLITAAADVDELDAEYLHESAAEELSQMR